MNHVITLYVVLVLLGAANLHQLATNNELKTEVTLAKEAKQRKQAEVDELARRVEEQSKAIADLKKAAEKASEDAQKVAVGKLAQLPSKLRRDAQSGSTAREVNQWFIDLF